MPLATLKVQYLQPFFTLSGLAQSAQHPLTDATCPGVLKGGFRPAASKW